MAVTVSIGQDDGQDEFQRRLKQLEKQLQDALQSGQPPSPDLLREIQTLTQQAQQRRAQEEGDWSPFGDDEDWRRIVELSLSFPTSCSCPTTRGTT